MLERRLPFVSFEGIEGSGKSTQFLRLFIGLRLANIPTIALREPGGTAIGEALRPLIMNTTKAVEPSPTMRQICTGQMGGAATRKIIDIFAESIAALADDPKAGEELLDILKHPRNNKASRACVEQFTHGLGNMFRDLIAECLQIAQFEKEQGDPKQGLFQSNYTQKDEVALNACRQERHAASPKEPTASSSSQAPALCPEAELLLFAAGRAQLVRQHISPNLKAGRFVLCDRFVDSAIAYQAAGRGLAKNAVELTNAIATEACLPELTFLFDLPAKRGLVRAWARSGVGADRFESETLAFHERVRQGYLELAAEHPERIIIMDARESIETLQSEVFQIVQNHFEMPSSAVAEESKP